jgi:hypothetical protein
MPQFNRQSRISPIDIFPSAFALQKLNCSQGTSLGAINLASVAGRGLDSLGVSRLAATTPHVLALLALTRRKLSL